LTIPECQAALPKVIEGGEPQPEGVLMFSILWGIVFNRSDVGSRFTFM
jgi:hypothetical protein